MTELICDIDVNDRIKKIRDIYGLKQSDICDITGYSVNTIKKWMMGKEQKNYTKAPVQAPQLQPTNNEQMLTKKMKILIMSRLCRCTQQKDWNLVVCLLLV